MEVVLTPLADTVAKVKGTNHPIRAEDIDHAFSYLSTRIAMVLKTPIVGMTAVYLVMDTPAEASAVIETFAKKGVRIGVPDVLPENYDRVMRARRELDAFHGSHI